nr:MAG TPA: hypothetical protein [Caudoviricetes sp.]
MTSTLKIRQLKLKNYIISSKLKLLLLMVMVWAPV